MMLNIYCLSSQSWLTDLSTQSVSGKITIFFFYSYKRHCKHGADSDLLSPRAVCFFCYCVNTDRLYQIAIYIINCVIFSNFHSMNEDRPRGTSVHIWLCWCYHCVSNGQICMHVDFRGNRGRRRKQRTRERGREMKSITEYTTHTRSLAFRFTPSC